jgi:glycosyltransferase involved in cell wall biosynthesis
MVGRRFGNVTTQGLILSELFRAAHYQVSAASGLPNRAARLGDILLSILRNRNFDIQCLEVYGGRSFVVEDVASWLGKLVGQRVVMILHGGAMPDFMRRYPRWTRRVLRRADAVVTPSPYLARAAAAVPVHPRVIPNVVDLSVYPHRLRKMVRPRLFWMRTFHPVWNPEMALRVLHLLLPRFADASLVMAGEDRGYQRRAEQLALQLGVAERVRFAGFLGPRDKTREADACDIYINTNRVDNMPVAVLEAWALGLPVISTCVGGIPDFIRDSETGLLVPDNDAAAMAKAVERLCSDSGLAGRLSANGREKAERCSWDNVRAEWEALFAQLTGATVSCEVHA